MKPQRTQQTTAPGLVSDMDTNGFKVDDLVQIGKGKALYRIESFHQYTPRGPAFAILAPVSGYTTASAQVDRLRLIV